VGRLESRSRGTRKKKKQEKNIGGRQKGGGPTHEGKRDTHVTQSSSEAGGEVLNVYLFQRSSLAMNQGKKKERETSLKKNKKGGEPERIVARHVAEREKRGRNLASTF